MSRIEEALNRAAGMKPAHTSTNIERVSKTTARVTMDNVFHSPVQTLSEETLVVINEPLSPAAEEYRKLKEYIVKSTRRDHFENLIAITSCTVGEGKSMTAVNLAASLASEYDHTVLLIDADLRRPTINKYLQLGACRGLSDCLRDGEDISDVLIKTGIGKLSVLPAGTPVSNPVELFTSDTMRLLFQEIKNRYRDRYIIVDTPPVLPFAETRSISRMTDWTLLVVREEGPTLDQVQEAAEALGNKVLGVVYNGSRQHVATSYYYYSSQAE